MIEKFMEDKLNKLGVTVNVKRKIISITKPLTSIQVYRAITEMFNTVQLLPEPVPLSRVIDDLILCNGEWFIDGTVTKGAIKGQRTFDDKYIKPLLQAWQMYHGLIGDGILGPKTRDSLDKHSSYYADFESIQARALEVKSLSLDIGEK